MKKVTNRYRIYYVSQWYKPYSVYVFIVTGRGGYWEAVSGNYKSRKYAEQWARRHNISVEN